MMENLILVKIDKEIMEECVDLFIDTFTREPWNDVYESRDQVVRFFHNHYDNNYFIGYAAMLDSSVVALSVGMKKPWINGLEYYIDEFCVSHKTQGKGIGSWFVKAIEEDIKAQGLNGIILNTEKDCPAHRFYEKNGFRILDGLVILGK